MEETQSEKTSPLIGKTFGRLTIIKREGRTENNKDTLVTVKCTCGGVKEHVKLHALKQCKPKTCGKCITSVEAGVLGAIAGKHQRKYQDDDTHIRNKFYREAKKAAAKSEREFSLTLEEYCKLTTTPCFHTGDLPTLKVTRWGQIGLHGLDRIDNGKGYTFENVLPASTLANMLRGSVSIQTFHTLACWIAAGDEERRAVAKDIFSSRLNRQLYGAVGRVVSWEDVEDMCVKIHAKHGAT